MIICIYCRKRLVQPIVRQYNNEYHLGMLREKGWSKILTKRVLNNILESLEFMQDICNNALDVKLATEERQKKFEEIKAKYVDCKV